MTNDRRPLRSRDARLVQRLAAGLHGLGATPNAVSATSMVFALIAASAFCLSGLVDPLSRALLLGLAAGGMGLRLLCNVLDGLLAVEHGRGSPTGPIWNERPDRISDTLIIVGAGYGAALMGAAWAAPLGWLAAVLALLTAYVRELGRGLGQPADYSGLGPKPIRMAILAVGAGLGVLEPLWAGRGEALGGAVVLTGLASAVTVFTRTRRLAQRLRRPEGPNS